MKRGLKRFWAGLLAAVMACVLCLPAMAAEKQCDTIVLDYVVADTEFRLYRVADADVDAVKWIPTEQFADYPVELNGLTDEGYRAAAQTLDGYVRRDRLVPMKTGKTDKDGKLTWSGLEIGLYLVSGEISEKDNTIYTPSPFLVAVVYTAEDGIILSDPKYDTDPKPAEPESCRVVKIWKDDGYSAERPKTVTIQLLRDGVVYDTVELSADNDWQYTWDKLEGGHIWQAAEVEMDGYTVESYRENDSFIVRNTRTPSPTPDPEKPDNPDNPTQPDNPSNPSGNDGDTTNGGGNQPYTTGGGNGGYTTTEEIPQTGQLWWPVAPLLAVGVILLSVGWSVWQKGKE